MKSKIAVVVHGRFHAFDLARGLAARGHEVTLFTIYPPWRTVSLKTADIRVRGFLAYGAVEKALRSAPKLLRACEPALHRSFGRWAATRVARESCDLVHCWSGVSEELLKSLRGKGTPALLMRGSAHIRTQARILEEEEKRTGVRIDRPTSWMIRREEKEYALADHIRVLSEFARRSFIEEGVPESKLHVIPPGMPVEAFRLSGGLMEERLRRILSGGPLRVLYVGTLSLRKGLWDLAKTVLSLPPERFRFRLVGPLTEEAKDLIGRLGDRVEIVPKQPERDLPAVYAGSDVFLFPTLEDGYAVTLSQAYAAGLPIITTDRCGGPDFLREGLTGWIVQAASPEAIIVRLTWADKHRQELAAMVRRVYETPRIRTWDDTAAELEDFIRTFGRRR